MRSIREFSSDADFVAFLKQIRLFVTSEDSPEKDFGGSYLHENLAELRKRFYAFQQQETEQAYQQR